MLNYGSEAGSALWVFVVVVVFFVGFFFVVVFFVVCSVLVFVERWTLCAGLRNLSKSWPFISVNYRALRLTL